MRRGGLLLTLWLAVAGSAIAIGTWALSLVGGEISNGAVEPMSQTDVDRQLDRAVADQGNGSGSGGQVTPTGPNVTPGATPTATSADPGTTLATAGGWIVASCQSGQVFLHKWSPAQGYRIDDVAYDSGRAVVKFESERAADVVATVWCQQGRARVSTATREHGDTSTTQHSSAPPPDPSSPAPQTTDDHGSGGHGADDGASDDDHHRRGQGSGGG